jgi:hypothetical protein
MDIKAIVKNNTVEFDYYRAGHLYYSVVVRMEEGGPLGRYIFPVPISDIGEATFPHREKAIFFMRYIRQAVEDKTFVKV